MEYSASCWIKSGDKDKLDAFIKKAKNNLFYDPWRNIVFLAPNQWYLDQTRKEWPEISFLSSHEQM